MLEFKKVTDFPRGTLHNILCDVYSYDAPYEESETLPILKETKKDGDKITYISARTAKIIKKFNYSELPMVDQLIADLYVLEDSAQADLFDYVALMKKNHSSAEREKDLKDIK